MYKGLRLTTAKVETQRGAVLFAERPVADSPYNVAPVGSGAFRFGEWRRADQLTMRANERYHLGRPPLDEVVWKCYPDQEAATDALLRGEVDYVPGVPPTLAPAVEGAPNLRICRSTDASFTYLGFQLEHPLFRDVRIRHALSHAIDRRRLITEVLQGERETSLSTYHYPQLID